KLKIKPIRGISVGYTCTPHFTDIRNVKRSYRASGIIRELCTNGGSQCTTEQSAKSAFCTRNSSKAIYISTSTRASSCSILPIVTSAGSCFIQEPTVDG